MSWWKFLNPEMTTVPNLCSKRHRSVKMRRWSTRSCFHARRQSQKHSYNSLKHLEEQKEELKLNWNLCQPIKAGAFAWHLAEGLMKDVKGASWQVAAPQPQKGTSSLLWVFSDGIKPVYTACRLYSILLNREHCTRKRAHTTGAASAGRPSRAEPERLSLQNVSQSLKNKEEDVVLFTTCNVEKVNPAWIVTPPPQASTPHQPADEHWMKRTSQTSVLNYFLELNSTCLLNRMLTAILF